MIGSGTFGNIIRTITGSVRTYPEKEETKKDSILNADFFLRYLHIDAKASLHIVERLGIEKSGTRITLITEKLNTNLEAYIERHPQGLTLAKTEAIARNITEALDFLNQSDVLYVNLKPEHILLSLDGKTVKLGHFDQADFNNGLLSLSQCTLETSYQSPETLLGIKLTPISNIWALGLIVNKMFTRSFYKSERKENIIASHQSLLERPYPEVLVKKSPDGGKTYHNSLSVDIGLTETLEQTVRRVSSLKQEDPEKTEELISLLDAMLSYTKRPIAQEVLGLPFFKQFSSKEPEMTSSQVKEEVDLSGGQWGLDLGRGGFGYVCEWITENATYAVKMNNKYLVESKEALLRENRMLRLLQKNPGSKTHIVERFTITKSTDDQYILLFLEKMGGDLYSYIKRHPSGLSLEKTKKFARQLLKGLEILWDADIIHLDLKPQNILVSLDGESIKIADFGSACFKDKACHPDALYLQTRFWRSPEVILEIPLTLTCDMWSFGIIIPEMFTDRAFSPGESEEEMIAYHHLRLQKKYPKHLVNQASKKGKNRFKQALVTPLISLRNLSQIIEHSRLEKTENSERSKLFIDFVQKALEYDPSKRMTPTQLLDHPFLKEEIV